jgi:hypothetical protein
MYNPAHFTETRRDVLHGLIHSHPLGALVTLGSAGLDAKHIPFELTAGEGPEGTLRGSPASGRSARIARPPTKPRWLKDCAPKPPPTTPRWPILCAA